jgi:hypothetical protein
MIEYQTNRRKECLVGMEEGKESNQFYYSKARFFSKKKLEFDYKKMGEHDKITNKMLLGFTPFIIFLIMPIW